MYTGIESKFDIISIFILCDVNFCSYRPVFSWTSHVQTQTKKTDKTKQTKNTKTKGQDEVLKTFTLSVA